MTLRVDFFKKLQSRHDVSDASDQTKHEIYIYIPGTQMTIVLNGKGLLLEGSNPKNRGQTGSSSRYIYIYK